MVVINPLEQAVMELLLLGDDAPSQTLRKQFEAASIDRRELTGVGFFLKFVVPSTCDRLPNGTSPAFGDVTAKIPGLQHGAGFVLFIKDGAIVSLEGYSYDEPWPSDVSDFELSLDEGSTANKDEI